MTLGPLSVFPDLTLEIAHKLGPDFPDLLWEDFSTSLVTFEPDRGRPDERATVDAGVVTARLKNGGGIFDPSRGAADGPNRVVNGSLEIAGSEVDDPTQEDNIDGWNSGSGWTGKRLWYPDRTTLVAAEGVSFYRATAGATPGATIAAVDSEIPTHSASRRHLAAVFVRVSSAWDGGTIRVELVNYAGHTVVARQDADLGIRDAWQRIWAIVDVGADVTGEVAFEIVGALPSTGKTIEFDFAELAELRFGQETIETGPLYPTFGAGSAIRISAGWRNDVVNPSFVDDAAGWTGENGATLTRTTDEGKFGPVDGSGPVASGRVVCDGSGSGRISTAAVDADASPGERWSAGAWVKGVGAVTVRVRALNGAFGLVDEYVSDPVTLDDDWARVSVATPPLPATVAYVQIQVRQTTAAAATFYVDGATLAPYPYPVPFLETEGGYPVQFVGRIEAVTDEWPSGGHDEIAVITATDLLATLGQRTLPTTNPPAESYADVVNGDRPFFYARQNEQTLVEMEVEVGPRGRYLGSPGLRVPGAIAGDFDRAVSYIKSNNSRSFNPIDASNFSGASPNRVTCEAWVKVRSGSSVPHFFFTGPVDTGGAVPVFELLVDGSPMKIVWRLRWSDGTGTGLTGLKTILLDEWYHVVGVWDGVDARIFVNGVLDNVVTPAAGKILRVPNETNIAIRLGGSPAANSGHGNVNLDEAVAYERALPEPRALAHYQAGLLGFPAQTFADRCDAVLDLFPYLVPASDRVYVNGALDDMYVSERRQHGQPIIDALRDVELASDGLVYAARDGRLVVLCDDWRNTTPKNRLVGKLSNVPSGGSLPYRDVQFAPTDDLLVFNVVQAVGEDPAGTLQVARDRNTSWRRERVEDLGEIPATGWEDVTGPGSGLHPDRRVAKIVRDRVARLSHSGRRLVDVSLVGSMDVDGELWRMILERDLEDVVDVEHYTPAEDFPDEDHVRRQRVRIKSVKHVVSGVRWTTAWTVAPADR